MDALKCYEKMYDDVLKDALHDPTQMQELYEIEKIIIKLKVQKENDEN